MNLGRQVIEKPDLVSGSDKVVRGVRADEACSACNENSRHWIASISTDDTMGCLATVKSGRESRCRGLVMERHRLSWGEKPRKDCWFRRNVQTKIPPNISQ